MAAVFEHRSERTQDQHYRCERATRPGTSCDEARRDHGGDGEQEDPPCGEEPGLRRASERRHVVRVEGVEARDDNRGRGRSEKYQRARGARIASHGVRE
jgi:hypothetical protein